MDVPINYAALQQCDTVIVENTTMPYIKSLYSCLNRIVGEGYTDNFEPIAKGLQSRKTNRIYSLDEISIINFFRFEGNSNPDDNVIMYIIETVDGIKGTCINSSATINENKFGSIFMRKSENMS